MLVPSVGVVAVSLEKSKRTSNWPPANVVVGESSVEDSTVDCERTTSAVQRVHHSNTIGASGCFKFNSVIHLRPRLLTSNRTTSNLQRMCGGVGGSIFGGISCDGVGLWTSKQFVPFHLMVVE